jgi:hypothetical protein
MVFPLKLLPTLTPPLTAPPLRVLAPKPSSFASSTTASMPCRTSSSAADSPAYPPPTIATRASRGTSTSSPTLGRYASHQKGVGMKSRWNMSGPIMSSGQ